MVMVGTPINIYDLLRDLTLFVNPYNMFLLAQLRCEPWIFCFALCLNSEKEGGVNIINTVVVRTGTLNYVKLCFLFYLELM